MVFEIMAAKTHPYTVLNKHPVVQRATPSLLKQENVFMFLYKQQFNSVYSHFKIFALYIVR